MKTNLVQVVRIAPGDGVAGLVAYICEDLQSVTYVVTGVLEHSDSLGNHRS